MSDRPAFLRKRPDDFDPKDGEIARLTWWLRHIYNARERPAIDLREMAYNAVAGDFAGPGEP
jgi:hypothetical protein